ncbi:sal-like protein 1 [Parasteatoda tepidariorum]|uniref:sal-like protein 1 n=1 Tax=Parasteatoda tepidariorum TaxID=114398 RepID=UPI00077FC3C2|nr:sal-like protein 1 [Parasteatoda tepidariorum]
MARRKQRKPKHLENAEELATSLQNGIGSDSETEGDEHVCGKCRAEFPTLSDFLLHKKICASKRPVLVAPLDTTMETDDEENSDDMEDGFTPPPPQLEGAQVDSPQVAEWLLENNKNFRSLLNTQMPCTNVTLQGLENTSVAVAQHSQLEEMLIQGLFNVITRNQQESMKLFKEWAKQFLASHPLNVAPLSGAPTVTSPQSTENGDHLESNAPPSNPLITEPYSIAGRLQQNLSMTNLSLDGPPETTNSLALLEKQADRYIQDSMARRSFLLNGIEDDNRSKKGKDDPATRHKCHFCGKLLGSDSALQIHVRSHTGEKPFQCNVCGSAFSTRGNLKVHFQRHKERMEIPGSFLNADQKQSDSQPSMPPESNSDNPPMLYGNDEDNHRGDSSKIEQALDFSTPLNGRKSSNPDLNSGSLSPNDTSNFSDNSGDGSSDDNMPDDYSDLKIDVERFDDEDRDTSNLDDDGSEVASHPSFGSPNFAPYFLSPYDYPVSTATSTAGNTTVSNSITNTKGANGDNSEAILQDPSYYQDLLPRIGSNDNSWESLIEITKTSETSKLQQLVDNIEHKLVEPNQCIICQRVLSCKSALQMHYRTHTGERPFRCKLCNRSFTTKGNLKTHMGVHRQKPVARLMHQCPVCHSQFPNAIVLQQHIRTHTTDHVMQLPPVFHPIDDRPPTLLPPSYPRQFLLQSQLVNSEPLALTSSKSQEDSKGSPANESVIKVTGLENNHVNTASSPLSARSSSPSSNMEESFEEKESKPPILNLAQSDRDVSPQKEVKPDSETYEVTLKTVSRNSTPEKDKITDSIPMDLKSNIKSSPKQESDQTPSNNEDSERESTDTPNRLEKLSPKFVSPPNTSLLVTLASDRPLPMTLPSDCPIPFSVHGPDRHYPPMSISNCSDYSTASLAALENHVKGINSSVTHPLPFAPHFGLGINMAGYFRDYNYPQKPTASPTINKNNTDPSSEERTTPGVVVTNGKGETPRTSSLSNQTLSKHDSNNNGGGALDLTPRSSPAFQRPATSDLKIFPPLAGLPFGPPHHRSGTTCRVCYKTFACNSALEIHYRSHTKERPFRCEVCDRGFSTKGNMRQHMLTHKIRDFPPQAFSTNSNSNSSPITSSPQKETSGEKSPKKVDEGVKRQSTDVALPPVPAKRAPGTPKHLCEVCHKPFSSGSALQIHMRTHTGDKPFQCHICHRAFTTKGNLKVHMGTHMWNNSTSRRGRRMSLDLGPLQLNPGAKPGEFAQPPYFPYLNPFMNGLPNHPHPPPPPPKMNEISVIQTAGMSNGSSASAPITTSPSVTTTPQPLSLLSSNKQLDRSSENSHRQNQIQSHSQGKDIHPILQSSQEIPASWPWKISCNVCNKICSSSTELELHIRNNHCNKKESAETERTD